MLLYLPWALWALCAVNIAMQLIDLHTTAEVVKRLRGVETNERLSGWVNDITIRWQTRFWRLAAIKFACVVAVVLVGAFPVVFPGQPPVVLGVMIAAQLWLAWKYAPVMRNNLHIYHQE